MDVLEVVNSLMIYPRPWLGREALVMVAHYDRTPVFGTTVVPASRVSTSRVSTTPRSRCKNSSERT